MSDFEHLRHWEDGNKLVANAVSAVSSLKKQSTECLKEFSDNQSSAKQRQEQALLQIQKNRDYQARLAEFHSSFLSLSSLPAQTRGYEFEKFLNELFRFFDLSPRGSFKIKGEQIDGAFTLDSTDYLMEAKWHSKPIANADLYAFSGKISGKLKNTLGLFISTGGFSPEALDANTSAHKSMILMDGIDLMMVLENRIPLPDLIRIKRRHAAETGEIFYRVL